MEEITREELIQKGKLLVGDFTNETTFAISLKMLGYSREDILNIFSDCYKAKLDEEFVAALTKHVISIIEHEELTEQYVKKEHESFGYSVIMFGEERFFSSYDSPYISKLHSSTYVHSNTYDSTPNISVVAFLPIESYDSDVFWANNCSTNEYNEYCEMVFNRISLNRSHNTKPTAEEYFPLIRKCLSTVSETIQYLSNKWVNDAMDIFYISHLLYQETFYAYANNTEI